MGQENKKSLWEEWKEVPLLEALKRRFCSPVEVTAGIETEEVADDAIPLCTGCLCPLETETYFCRECDAPTGQYTTMMAYQYIWCMGRGFRAGTDPNSKLTPFQVVGYVLASLLQYGFFAPVYWVFLCRACLTSSKRKREESD